MKMPRKVYRRCENASSPASENNDSAQRSRRRSASLLFPRRDFRLFIYDAPEAEKRKGIEPDIDKNIVDEDKMIATMSIF